MSQSEDSFAFWRRRGVSVRTTNVLLSLGCNTLDDIRNIEFENYLYHRGGVPGIGRATYDEIAGLISNVTPPPVWSPDDITDDDDVDRHSVRDEEQQIDFFFLCPSVWKFSASAVMRIKIERGILFFKPGGKSTGFQEMPIVDWTRYRCRAVMHAGHYSKSGSISRAFLDRMVDLIRQIGWTERMPYFAMSPAQRGWHEIASPSAESPSGPHVMIDIRH